MRSTLTRVLSILLLANWIGALPAWAEEGGPKNVHCGEMFRRTIREELGRGDPVWIIYRDGHTVRGRFMGFVKDRPEFLVAPGEGGFERSTAHGFSGMQTLRYRRIASDGPNIFFGTIFVGAVAGFFAGCLVAKIESSHDDGGETIGWGYAAYPLSFGFLGALVGLGVGIFLPRLIVPAKTIECGPSPVYDGGAGEDSSGTGRS